jgi:ankyrin repeat protein
MLNPRISHQICICVLFSFSLLLSPACGSEANSSPERLATEPQKTTQVEGRTNGLTQALFAATTNGGVDEVKKLISQGVDINAKNADGQTALHIAVSNDNKKIVQFLIEKGADVNTKNGNGRTPLDTILSRSQFQISRNPHHAEIKELLLANGAQILSIHGAVHSGDLEKVKEFLEQGTDINAKDEDGDTPLHIAVEQDYNDIAKLLIDRGADVNAGDQKDYTPLYSAIWNRNRDLVGLLIGKGADVNVIPEEGAPPLLEAVWMGDFDVVKLLIDNGASNDVKDKDSWTALHHAASQASVDMVRLFISKGVDTSSIHMAACAGDLSRVKGLLEQGIDVDTKDEAGWTALVWAVNAGQTEVAEFLINNNANVSVRYGRQNQSLLHQAARLDSAKLAELLIAKGIDVNAKNRAEATPLSNAASAGNLQVMELLVSRGADVNAKNRMGQTPLHLACRNGKKEVVEFLIDKGADVNARPQGAMPALAGRTPLYTAVSSGKKEIVELLVSHGSNVTVEILNLAKQRGNSEIVELLHNRGLDASSVDKYGRTPLHTAVSAGNIDLVKLLIAHGARLDIKDNAGRVPLHYTGCGREGTFPAAMPDIIRILLDNQADINAQDNAGITPVYYAAERRRKDIVQLFIDKGADIDVTDNRGYTPYQWIKAKISVLEIRMEEAQTPVRLSGYQEIARLLKRSEHYVAIDGKDTNPGTFERPFGSLSLAIEVAEPGDTILVRGGTYLCPQTIRIRRSGLPGKPILIKGYAGEVPVLDCSAVRTLHSTEGDCGIMLMGSYWHIKDIVVTDVCQGVSIEGEQAHHNVLEQVVAHRAGIGIVSGAAHNLIINCDVCQNVELLRNGGNADGFLCCYSVGVDNILMGNRSWNNSDDGFDMWYAGDSVRLESCYAWRNGENIWSYPFFGGNANGFKLGGGEGRHILINCVAWGHSHRGFDLNGNTQGVILYNCTGWDNSANWYFLVNLLTSNRGAGSVFRNNLSYAGLHVIGRMNDSQYNSWDDELGITLTDRDFLSLDDSMMTAPRNADGSIPYNNFLRLAPGSAAIDAGTDVNMPYLGKAPDLGAFEYDPNAPRQGYVKMLHQYVRDHDVARINELLDAGTDVNEKDWLGYAPLHWACYFGYVDLAELLISKGAKPSLVSGTGRTPLEIATSMQYDNIAELLRKHGAKE